jgi:hypothetical protein
MGNARDGCNRHQGAFTAYFSAVHLEEPFLIIDPILLYIKRVWLSSHQAVFLAFP